MNTSRGILLIQNWRLNGQSFAGRVIDWFHKQEGIFQIDGKIN